MHISELDTPALLIDLDVMERNLTQIADYVRTHKLRLRPHTKTHKIPAFGRRQVDLGAVGLTVAKVGEAEVMLGATPDLLVAYPVIGALKLARLMEVSHKVRVTVSLDSLDAARPLSEAAAAAKANIGILVEMDVGLGRVGVKPAEVVDLAKQVAGLPGLEFRGIAFYPGHIRYMNEDGYKALDNLGTSIEGVKADLSRAGLEAAVVSGGSTPTLWHSHEIRGLNEIRPGTYIFNDRNTVLGGSCKEQDCAVSILATVVSTSVKDQMIIDGGSKTFSSDRLITGEPGYGHVVECPEAVFSKMNEEHGYVELPGAAGRFRVGDRVHVVPNHVCVAMNLHETVYGIRGETVEQSWRVEGRGKLQ